MKALLKALMIIVLSCFAGLNAYSQQSASDTVKYPTTTTPTPTTNYTYQAINEEENPQPWPKHRLGAMYSTITASGLSYQYQPNEIIAMRFTGYAYADIGNNGENNYNYDSDELTTNFGADLQVNLLKITTSRFYLLFGLGNQYQEHKGYTYNGSGTPQYTTIHRYIQAGAGFGLEFLAWRHVSFNLDLGYMFQGGYHSFSLYSPDKGKEKTIKIGPAFGLGAYYAF